MAATIQKWTPASDADVQAFVAFDDEDDNVPHVCVALIRAGVLEPDPHAEYLRLHAINQVGG